MHPATSPWPLSLICLFLAKAFDVCFELVLFLRSQILNKKILGDKTLSVGILVFDYEVILIIQSNIFENAATYFKV